MNEIQALLSKSEAALRIAEKARMHDEVTRYAALSSAYANRALALMHFYPSKFNERQADKS